MSRLFSILLVFHFSPVALSAEEPTLARLSFWLPPERMAAFESLYKEHVLPVLQTHDLTDSSQLRQTTVDSVFNRLFVLSTVTEVANKRQALAKDPAWEALLRHLGKTFDKRDAGGLLPFHFGLYRAPAGAGTRIEASPGFRQGLWQTFGAQNGLSHITAVLQDRQGQMWFAMAGGVSRYDGVQFTTFTTVDGLASNRVTSILEDRQGRLWFGTDLLGSGGEGLSRYDGKTFVTFTTADGLGSNLVEAIFEDAQGQVWVGTEGGGVSRYDGKEWITFTTADGLAANSVGAVLEDRQGRLWFGSGRWGQSEGGVSRYDGEAWATFTTADGLAANSVSAILEDRQGRLWFGTHEGVSRYDGAQFASVEALAGERIMAIVEDDQGHLWFATKLNGIRRFDGKSWLEFTYADGVANDQVWSVAKDRQGTLWFGTVSGVSRRDQGLFTHFTSADGLVHNGVVSILEDRQGALWFGTLKGVSRYDGNQFTTPEPLLGWSVWAMEEDRQGQLWFGDVYMKGVLHYDGHQFTSLTTADGLGSNSVWSIYEDRRGHMWFGSRTGDGVSRYDGKHWVRFTTEEGLAAKLVSGILENRRGHMWFAAIGGGVSRYDGGQFYTLTSQDGLASNSVGAILEDRQGNLWFGTSDGVSRYDGQSFQTLTRQDGLVSEQVRALLEDHRGHLWIGTFGGGISRYDGQSLQTLTRQDGLIHDAVQALLQDSHGDIWIGTEGGISRYRPSTVPPTIQLQAVIADQRYQPTGEIRIPGSQKLVVFQFQGGSLTTLPQRMAYTYRLEGHDGGWQSAYTNRVEYQNLPEGTYTFQVKAVDQDLNYSQPVQVRLEIYPQTFSIPVRLTDVHLEDVFASFYPSYDRQSLGWVEVANEAPDSLAATLRFDLPELMRRPFEVPLSLAPLASQRVKVRARLDPAILAVNAVQRVQAELTLSFAWQAEGEMMVRRKQDLAVYGPGALRWDTVGRAAAFITSEDPVVADFGRPLLVAFEATSVRLGKPGRNLVWAMVLFQALKAHGVRYVPDANTPYAQLEADQGAVDHIQYPAEVLQRKTGDCDDLTALYCSLLENAGIPTALVDYPGHIFLLFDSGVSREQAYTLPVEEKLYVLREQGLWIPVEITHLGQSFWQAWQVGGHELAQLSAIERRQRVVNTAAAWKQFPAVAPLFEDKVEAPAAISVEAAVETEYTTLKGAIDEYIDETYLDPLKAAPDNDALRTQLLQVYLALHQVDAAIDVAATYLLDERGDKATILNHLGIAYFMKGEISLAAYQYKQAAALRPEDKGIQRNLEQALNALGRDAAKADQLGNGAENAGDSKAAPMEIDIHSFYWIEE